MINFLAFLLNAESQTLVYVKTRCLSRYLWKDDPLGTPIFPIPKDSIFKINDVAFMVRASNIQGASLGIFLHTPMKQGVNILHYGGDKYSLIDWKMLCRVCPRASRYSLLEDPKVDCKEDVVYIVGDEEHGNVAGYINSSHRLIINPNVRFTLYLNFPPWYNATTTRIN